MEGMQTGLPAKYVEYGGTVKDRPERVWYRGFTPHRTLWGGE